MNWKNLQSYKCPECSEPLEQDGGMHVCTLCTFKIGEEKLKSIIGKNPTRYIEPDRTHRGIVMDDKTVALILVNMGFRNTLVLEDLHAGKVPYTETGDYSDVKVVTPHGEIPWNEVSRFRDEEMKKLMIESVNNVYTLLKAIQHGMKARPIVESMLIPYGWDEPKVDEQMFRLLTGKEIKNYEGINLEKSV